MSPAPTVLFATDKRGWSFDNIAKQLSRALSLWYQSKISPYTLVPDREPCDVVAALWWVAALRVKGTARAGALITCLYDHLSWCVDSASREQFRLTLHQSSVLGVCNKKLKQEVEAMFPDDLPKHVLVLEDGVDVNLFKPSPLPETFCCGWTGNSSRHTPGGPDDHKGLNLIKQACQRADCELHVLDGASGGIWPLRKMPEFYKQISCYVCGSFTEGTPNPILESLASGRPVVSTPVGLAPDVVLNGRTGFISERSVEALTSAILAVKSQSPEAMQAMSQQARAVALKHTWEKKAEAWKRAIDVAMMIGSPSTAISIPRASSAPPAPVEIIEPVERRISSPPRILLLSDVREWAFHQNLRDLDSYLNDRFNFEHYFVADFLGGTPPPDFPAYDGVFAPYHRWPIAHLYPWDRMLGSLRALWFKPEKQLPPQPDDIELVNRFRAFHVVTKQNLMELEDRCPNVVYLTNPVDMKRFEQSTQVTDRLVASWNGNAQHRSSKGDFVKGFFDIVMPVCKATGTPLEYAEYHSKRLSHEQMPGFYLKANVALCASSYEGASNSVMEAMACGQAIISTAAGNIIEIKDSQTKHLRDSGIMIVERSIKGFAEGLEALKKDLGRVKAMGEANREEIKLRWSWSAWANPYADFLRMAF